MMTIKLCHVALLAALLSLALVGATNAQSGDDVHRFFELEASVVSYLPDKGLEGSNRHRKSMIGNRLYAGLDVTRDSALSFEVKIKGVFATVNITPRIKSGRVSAVIDLAPEEAKRLLGFQQQTLDLNDLKPAAIRLAMDESGRVFQLNLVPSVSVTDNTPQPFDVAKLRLRHWHFYGSPVLVNDAQYVGRVGMSGSPVAFVDISGVARVEFSLHELAGAKPWGVLHRGMLTLTNPEDKTTILISNVLNGNITTMELPGGPYRVWVRWSPPSRSVEQHRQEMVELRKRIASGELPSTDATYLDKQLARPPAPWLYSSGLGELQRGEQVKQAD